MTRYLLTPDRPIGLWCFVHGCPRQAVRCGYPHERNCTHHYYPQALPQHAEDVAKDRTTYSPSEGSLVEVSNPGWALIATKFLLLLACCLVRPYLIFLLRTLYFLAPLLLTAGLRTRQRLPVAS